MGSLMKPNSLQRFTLGAIVPNAGPKAPPMTPAAPQIALPGVVARPVSAPERV